MPVVGPFYSKREIERVWVEEGGDPRKADLASAIVLAESGGGAGSWSPNPGPCRTNWGWYQLCRANGLGMLDIRRNTREAIRQSNNGRNWCDWQTWDGRGCAAGNYTGAYRQHLRGAPPLPAGAPGEGGQGPILHPSAPLPAAESAGERKWDYSPAVRAAARAHQGHARVIATAAANVLTKLTRFRLPRA